MIDKKQIEHLARLSRISLSSEEIISFQHQVADILNFVSILQKIDTSDIIPSFYLAEQTNFRDDEIKVFPDRDNLISAMPEKKDSLLKIPKIFS